MIRRPPRSTRTDTLFPYTTLFRSATQQLRGRTLRLDPAWPEKVAHNWTVTALLPASFPLEAQPDATRLRRRSEEHTSELQSLMRISYAVFCLKKKNKKTTNTNR